MVKQCNSETDGIEQRVNEKGANKERKCENEKEGGYRKKRT